MQRILAAALFALFAFVTPSHAQIAPTVLPSGCGTGAAGSPALGYLTVDSTLKLCVNAAVSASVTGFHVTASLAPITATTGGASSSSFTAGFGVLVSNTGATNTAYCSPGASASTSSTPVLPGQTVELQTTTETQITCVTSTSTTAVNLQTGNGLATGWGGSGSGGGSSGAVFGPTAVGSANANPPVVVGGTVTGAAGQNVVGAAVKAASTQAAATDTSIVVQENPGGPLYAAVTAPVPCKAAATWNASTGLTGTNPTGCDGSAALWGDIGAVGGSALALGSTTASASIPVVISSNQTAADPCMFQLKKNAAIATSSITTQVVAPSGSTKVYICSLVTVGATAAAESIIEGTGATCTTSNEAAIIGSTTAANGMSFAANNGFAYGAGMGMVGVTATAGNGVCLLQSTGAAVAGNITFVQQ